MLGESVTVVFVLYESAINDIVQSFSERASQTDTAAAAATGFLLARVGDKWTEIKLLFTGSMGLKLKSISKQLGAIVFAF